LQWSKASSDFGSAVTSASGKINFGDFLNLFFFSQKYDIGVLIRAMQQRGLFQSLAEPNLVAESGKEASFLAGGEFPVPVAQGSGANLAVSVQFKEFGVRLNFTPTINGDRVHLKVRPEVSTLDFANAVVLSGFRIPALSTRRTETEIELRNGQTFAIAGLLNNQMQSTMQKIPGIGDIPILGYLFRSKVAQKDQTELVVMITPEILAADSPGVTDKLPRTPDTFMSPLSDKQLKDPLPPAFTPARKQATVTTPPAAAPTTAARTLDPSEQAALAAAQRIDAQQRAAAEAAAAQAATVPTEAAAPATVVQQPAEQPRTEKQMKEEAKREAEALRKERELAEKLAKEQAKRDAAAAKEKAKADKLAAEEAKKKEAEEKKQAKRQAALLEERQQQIDAASERLRASETAYQSELAKQSSR
jgi:Flp pilus assembly secretin CpaC